MQARPQDDEQRRGEEALRRKLYPALFDSIDRKQADIDRDREYLAAGQAELQKLASQLEGAPSEEDAQRIRSDIRLLEIQHEESLLLEHTSLAEIAELQADPRFSARAGFLYDDPGARTRDETLADMLGRMDDFTELIEDVRTRLVVTRDTVRATMGEPEARLAWSLCTEDVGREDSPYGDLVLQPEEGLLPLGIDAESGLWEFWHVESGKRPAWEPAPPQAESGAAFRGRTKLEFGSGIVLVLLPGGQFSMGGASMKESEPIHSVDVSPFYIGKFEVTQIQWINLMRSNPSACRPGQNYQVPSTFTELDPVENVSWNEAVEACRRWSVLLPTERQWEYACRAGTVTEFWCGDDARSIAVWNAGNIADATARQWGFTASFTPEVRDGFPYHAPVGCYAPNPFGLHDVLGNVRELCRDGFGMYRVFEEAGPKDGDVVSDQGDANRRIVRGGSFAATATSCGSGWRGSMAPANVSLETGFRVSLPCSAERP
jgi:formylglycine-generating enzyme required for sulfatase activity